MKQIIVMIAMIMLGISIAGFVGEFSSNAREISNQAKDRIDTEITYPEED